MEVDSQAKKQLVRDVNRVGLTRMEDAARTVKDFEQVIAQWNHLDENRERRERYYEIGRDSEEKLHLGARDEKTGEIEFRTALETVIPRPLEHEWWRQLLQGDFLDVIFDCPHELRELVHDEAIADLLDKISDNHREMLYYGGVRLYSNQKIAAIRGQTDRNILKMRTLMVAALHKKLIPLLIQRVQEGKPITTIQRVLLNEYLEQNKTTLDKQGGG